MELKELLRKIKEKFTKEKLIGYWQWLWGKESEPVDESVLEDPDRYVKLDDENDDKYWTDIERFKKEKGMLKFKRIFIVFVIVFSTIYIIKSVYTALSEMPLFSCLGKNICLYKGPKINNPTQSPIGVRLKDGNIFVSNNGFIYYKDKDYDSRGFLTAEIYNKDTKKFEKIYNYRYITITRSRVGDVPNSRLTNLIQNKEGNVLLIDTHVPIEIFDTKNRKFQKTDCNLFQWSENGTPFIFIDRYDENSALIMSTTLRNKIGLDDIEKGNAAIETKEHFSLFNLSNFSMTSLPDFAKQPMHYPMLSDVIILDNGKIIVPFRYNTSPQFSIGMNYIPSRNYEVDHIEIYDPMLNNFFAVTDKSIIDNNLFHIVLPDNNVLFVNKGDSYIFDNEKNEFFKVEGAEAQRLEKIKQSLDIELRKLLDSNIDELINKSLKITHLQPDKLLITCDIEHMLKYQDFSFFRAKKLCRNTVYFDYKKNIVKKGPTFTKHDEANMQSIVPITKSKFMIMGLNNLKTDLPEKNVYILELK